MNNRIRRVFSIALMVAGGVLIFLAPENVWIGIVMVLLGVAMEALGILLAHQRKPAGGK